MSRGVVDEFQAGPLIADTEAAGAGGFAAPRLALPVLLHNQPRSQVDSSQDYEVSSV